MKNKVKTMRREDWHRVTSRAFAAGPVETGRYRGEAGLLSILAVTAPLTVRTAGASLVAADAGYRWLQFAPCGENWWLTAMLDGAGEIVQYYFDVTLENRVRPGGDSEFTDLYLDVVMLPDGKTELLDRDELDEARAEGLITPEEHALACETAARLLSGAPAHLKDIKAFCLTQAARLGEKL